MNRPIHRMRILGIELRNELQDSSRPDDSKETKISLSEDN